MLKQQIINRVREIILKYANPERIYLYGSQVNGEADRSSDIDIAYEDENFIDNFKIEEEVDAPPFFYTTNDIASFLKTQVPKIEDIFERLRKRGYTATGTHFTPTGFKTNAPLDIVKEVFKEHKT